MTDTQNSFTVGQIVKITGGKHAKTLDDEVSKCIITSIKSTFCEVTIFKRDDAEDPGTKIQCHRKFLEGAVEQLPPSTLAKSVEVAVDEPVGEVFEMPDASDCVPVTESVMETINRERSADISEQVREVAQDVVEEVMNDNCDIGVLRARIGELETDCASYRDMLLGCQNELAFMRTQTAPTEDERKKRNETIINCINLLCRLQV